MGKLLWNAAGFLLLAILALVNSGCSAMHSAVPDTARTPSATTANSSTAVRVYVAPSTTSVEPNAAIQFMAGVSSARNKAVMWEIASGGGKISPSGLYTAPATSGRATIRATSVSAPRSSALAYVTITSRSGDGTGTTPGSGATPPAHSVTLTWDTYATNVAGHNIYRSQTSGGPYVRLNGPLDPYNSFADSSIMLGGTYYYVVTAVDLSGAESAYSEEVVAKIPL